MERKQSDYLILLHKTFGAMCLQRLGICLMNNYDLNGSIRLNDKTSRFYHMKNGEWSNPFNTKFS